MKAAIAVVGLLLLVAVAAPASARADDASGSLLTATAEAYAMRVEYDLPVPAGTGTVAHVSANAQRSASVESGHGIAAAPSELDAVVGGKYADPQSTGHPTNRVPQTECNYPSDTPTTVFRFPTDTNEQAAGTPATSYAYASCGAGPSVELRARVGDPTAAAAPDPAAAVSPATAEASGASIEPDKGVLHASASSTAHGIALAGGALTIGSVTANGASATAGTPGTAASEANVTVSDIAVAGTSFSLSFKGAGADEAVTLGIAGQELPIGDTAAKAVFTAANAALAPTGCAMTVVSDPAKYPQGFLFSRPQPDIGVEDDGSLAASYRGGLLVVCDVPDNPVADATKFSPERFQALLGFVYTSVAAHGDIGGFGIGDTGGDGSGGVGLGAVVPTESALGIGATSAPVGLPAPVELAATTAHAAAGTPDSLLTRVLEPLSPGERWLLLVSCVALWGWLTHLGLTRLLRIGAAPQVRVTESLGGGAAIRGRRGQGTQR